MDKWNLLIAILGVVGTAIGAYLGYRGALRAALIQIEQSTHTRFDEPLLQAFRDFLIAAATLSEQALESPPNHHSPEKMEFRKRAIADLEDSFLRIDLLARPGIRDAAGSARNSALLLVDALPLPHHLSSEQVRHSHFLAIEQMKSLIRHDYGSAHPHLRGKGNL